MTHTTDILQFLEMHGPGVVGNVGLEELEELEELERDSEPGPEGMDTDLRYGMMAVSAGKVNEPHRTALVLQGSGSHSADGWVVAALVSPEDIRGSSTVAVQSCSGLSAGDAGSLEELGSQLVELPLLGPHPRYQH